MIELLVIKGHSTYFRFTDHGYQGCAMGKASVYSLGKADEVRTLLDQLHQDGRTDAHIMKLSITEEPFQD